jgi:hypothetical protein
MSHLIHFISHAFKQSSAAVIISTVLATFVSIAISRLVFKEKKDKIIKSPVASLLPSLSQVEKDALPYPPDSFPGGRDVDSPVSQVTIITNFEMDDWIIGDELITDYTVWHNKSI